MSHIECVKLIVARAGAWLATVLQSIADHATEMCIRDRTYTTIFMITYSEVARQWNYGNNNYYDYK